MKVRIISITLAIVAMLFTLLPHQSYGQQPDSAAQPVTSNIKLPTPVLPDESGTPVVETVAAAPTAADSPCFYTKSDGTVVDLRAICGQQSDAAPVPAANGVAYDNPAMQITPPNDPGVLYISNSGDDDPAAAAASRAEETGDLQQ